MIFLVATGIWNPFPGIWSWANASRPVSDPDPAWQERIGGRPQTASLAGNVLVVELHTFTEGRRASDGSQIWSRKADWSAVAGVGKDSVAVLGKLLVKGYDVVDPTTGSVLRHEDDAVGVWTYREAILDVRCRGTRDCTMTASAPRTGNRLWQVDIPGVGFVLFADNPKLQVSEVLGTRRVADHAHGPMSMPRVLGFSIDQSVHFIDTAEGRALPEIKPDRREQVVAVAGRVLRITATASDGACYLAVDGRDARTGAQVWQEPGLNLRTTSGAGCEQRRLPSGAGNVIVAVAGDGREVVFDAYDGRTVWTGGDGEKVLAVDNRHALVRSSDGRSIKGVRLGQKRPLWTRGVRSGAEAALAGDTALVLEKKPGRIVALDLASGAEKLNVGSTGKVIACGPDGLFVSAVREVGYLPYQTVSRQGASRQGASQHGASRHGASRQGAS